MAVLGSRNSNRLYNISDPIFGSYEYDSEVSREEEQRTLDEVRSAPTNWKSIHR